MTRIAICSLEPVFLLHELAPFDICGYPKMLMRTKGEAKEEMFHPLSLLQYLIVEVQVDY
jgi:hypothetical protein